MNIALKRAVELAGGPASLGGKINESTATICNWQARTVPAAKCPAVERAVGGKVTCEELRPDEKWARIADPEWPHPSGRPLLDVSAAAKEG